MDYIPGGFIGPHLAVSELEGRHVWLSLRFVIGSWRTVLAHVARGGGREAGMEGGREGEGGRRERGERERETEGRVGERKRVDIYIDSYQCIQIKGNCFANQPILATIGQDI